MYEVGERERERGERETGVSERKHRTKEKIKR